MPEHRCAMEVDGKKGGMGGRLGATEAEGGGEVSFGGAERETPGKHGVRYFFFVGFHSLLAPCESL